MRITLNEYTELCRTHNVRIKGLRIPTLPPIYYARVATKDDDTVISYMCFDAAREEWEMFSPSTARGEVLTLFK